MACEVGFGGGAVLSFLQQECGEAYGIETVTLSIENAISRGIPKERLFNALSLPPVIQKKIDLWIFLDSFEHIPNPGEFLSWMENNTAPRADIILVAPQAGSLSEVLLGRLWPHKLPDHPFQWSKVGIESLFAQRGFELRSSFFPLKHISLTQVLTILGHKFGFKGRCPSLFESHIVVPFNFGQMGLHISRGK
ncbi:MAG: methyltransferase domain-containing protein [Proteobacteria bacterium]|nr:methyltransferase domain-containing protein [Pseudomonadota bacterium]